ncbi:hypothetical protein QS257_12090 [Terrilactibacillus sp. S3-3]|nr:hypothetical protein QS257_12090 [Terrilactibacillus sp. S3-3]
MTDYNHVLSDVNFNFLKTLAKLGKPFYLIVNQIDKHNEKEGSFASFKAHVESALSDWQLYPQKIFYLSLVSENVPNNDFQTFLAFLDEMMEGKAADHEDLLQGLQALAEQHRTFLKKINSNSPLRKKELTALRMTRHCGIWMKNVRLCRPTSPVSMG